MGKQWADGYSSDVELYLIVGACKVPLAQVGPGHAILQDVSPGCDPTTAQLLIIIDGAERYVDVLLPYGIPANSDRLEYVTQPDPTPRKVLARL